MKIKLLLGSIGIVILLILVSFSNVVGILSVESNVVGDSPLFNIKINKATKTESNNSLTSNYIGKGLHTIQFPLRDDRNILIQKVIQIIQKMDEKEFNRFNSLILSRIHNEKNITDTDRSHILSLLKISNIPKDSNINQFNIFGNLTHPPTLATCFPTCFPLNCFTSGVWFPGCHLLSTILILIIGLLGIYLEILYILINLP